MNNKFEKIINQIPDLKQTLIDSPLRQRDSLADIPKKGIYVFYEINKSIDVGHSNRMKERILEHSRNHALSNDKDIPSLIRQIKAHRWVRLVDG